MCLAQKFLSGNKWNKIFIKIPKSPQEILLHQEIRASKRILLEYEMKIVYKKMLPKRKNNFERKILLKIIVSSSFENIFFTAPLLTLSVGEGKEKTDGPLDMAKGEFWHIPASCKIDMYLDSTAPRFFFFFYHLIPQFNISRNCSAIKDRGFFTEGGG